MRTAVETLAAARAARSAGDAEGCALLSAASLSLAQDEHDADTAFLAASTPGHFHIYRGEPELAEDHFRHGLNVALSGGLTLRLPMAYHDLHNAARESRNNESARRFFATAVELHLDLNPRNPRLTALLADAALSAFVQRPNADTAADALQAWRAVPASLAGSSERFLSGCYMMAAAAWLGIDSRYRDGFQRIEESYPQMDSYEGASLALSFAATAATNIRDYPRAAYMAERAFSIAVARGERIAAEQARFVLDAALAERPVRA